MLDAFFPHCKCRRCSSSLIEKISVRTMAEELVESNDSVETFQKGDRVIVNVLGRRRHGHMVAVGSHTCAIHFDTGNGKANFQTVLVPPTRIKRERWNSDDANNSDTHNIPLSCTIQNRASVHNGALVHGSPLHDGCPSTIYNAAAMNGIMHLIRWMTAKNSYCHFKMEEKYSPSHKFLRTSVP